MSRKIPNRSNTEADKAEEPPTKRARVGDIEEAKVLIGAIEECIKVHDDNRVEVQERLHSICDEWRKEIDGLENKINGELEAKYTEEDNRLQEALNDLKTAVIMTEEKGDNKLSEAAEKARTELLVMQTYKLIERALSP